MCLINTESLVRRWRNGWKVLYDPRIVYLTAERKRARRWFWQDQPSRETESFWAGKTIQAAYGFHVFKRKSEAERMLKSELDRPKHSERKPRVVRVRILADVEGEFYSHLSIVRDSYRGNAICLHPNERRKHLKNRRKRG